MVLKAEVLDILKVEEDKVVVFASYCRGHRIWSPRGFEYTFIQKEPQTITLESGKTITLGKLDLKDIKVGLIWDIGGSLSGSITAYPENTLPLLGPIPSDRFFLTQEIELQAQSIVDRVERRKQIKKNKITQLFGLVEAIKKKVL